MDTNPILGFKVAAVFATIEENQLRRLRPIAAAALAAEPGVKPTPAAIDACSRLLLQPDELERVLRSLPPAVVEQLLGTVPRARPGPKPIVTLPEVKRKEAELAVLGMPNGPKAIAAALGYSERTVRRRFDEADKLTTSPPADLPEGGRAI